MREITARIVGVFTGILVVALAHLFAQRHNPPIDVPPGSEAVVSPAAPAPVAETNRGREVYNAQGCASCHAIGGVGNPRNPLDGVGQRRSAAELRDWITGTGSAVDELAPAVKKRKQRYQQLPDEELKALVSYLSTLDAKS